MSVNLNPFFQVGSYFPYLRMLFEACGRQGPACPARCAREGF